MKKVFVLILVFAFFASTVPALAQKSQGEKAASCDKGGKSIFQIASDDITCLGKNMEKQKPTKLFQRSYDYIVETSPKARERSLRENPSELSRRRGGR